MKIEELLVYGKSHCHSDHTKILLAELLNLNPLELNLHLNDLVSFDNVNKYKECLENIENGIPIQYALKNVNFYG